MQNNAHGSLGRLVVDAVAACVLACAASSAGAQTSMTAVAIDKMALGLAPMDFDFARTGQGEPGRWLVVADRDAGGGRAIEQSSTERTDYRFPLAIYRPLTARNAEATVRFKPVAGSVDRAGGLALRLIDPDNYYVVRANALEDNVRLYRVVKGSRQQLATANVKVTANEWHTLALKAEGERLSIVFDGKPLYAVTDRTFTEAGKVALWTKADSVTRFDRLTINTLP
jgi:hypothetical protein